MSNQEIILSDLKYLKDCGVKLKIYHNVEDANDFIIENNGIKSNFKVTELKDFFQNLKDEIEDLNEQQAKKRRLFRAMLLEASEEIAHKFSKQVFTLSIGDNDDNK